MEEGQARGEHVARAHIAQHRAAVRRDELAAVRVRDEPRRAGGAAGVEVGGDVVVSAWLAEDEPVVGLRHQCAVEVDHAGFERRARRGHPQQRQAGQPLAQGERLLPDIERGVRAERHQDLRARGLQQPGDVLRLEQEIDRHRIPRGLRAPERGLRLDQTRQHVGHGRPRADQRGEQVGRAPHQAQQFAVGHAARLLVRRAGHQLRQRNALGLARRSTDEDIEDASLGQPLFQRHRGFETRDVGGAADAGVGQDGHGRAPWGMSRRLSGLAAVVSSLKPRPHARWLTAGHRASHRRQAERSALAGL